LIHSPGQVLATYRRFAFFIWNISFFVFYAEMSGYNAGIAAYCKWGSGFCQYPCFGAFYENYGRILCFTTFQFCRKDYFNYSQFFFYDSSALRRVWIFRTGHTWEFGSRP
jgi:hypothetical protein